MGGVTSTNNRIKAAFQEFVDKHNGDFIFELEVFEKPELSNHFMVICEGITELNVNNDLSLCYAIKTSSEGVIVFFKLRKWWNLKQ